MYITPRADALGTKLHQSFISKLHYSISNGLPHAEPVSILRVDEEELVRGVLQMLQGFSTSWFYWDDSRAGFCVKRGVYVSHLSHTSLNGILYQFVYSGACLKKVESFIMKVRASHQQAPTMEAFSNSVCSWLKRLRDIVLKEEKRLAGSDNAPTITLLGLSDNLSSFCAGAECLLQVVYEAVPNAYFESDASIPAGELAVYILDHLFKKLNEVCFVQGGEEEVYHMVLAIFVGSILPYLEALDSWLYDGILDDPFEEMFFYRNNEVAIEQPAFWERSYLLRQGRWRAPRADDSLIPAHGEYTSKIQKEDGNPTASSAGGRDQSYMDHVACPLFLVDLGRAILSAGKSLQLVQYFQEKYVVLSTDVHNELNNLETGMFTSGCQFASGRPRKEDGAEHPTSLDLTDETQDSPWKASSCQSGHINHAQSMSELTLSEVFLISLVGLIGDGDRIYDYLGISSPEIDQRFESSIVKCLTKDVREDALPSTSYEKIWFKFLTDAIRGRKNEICSGCNFGASDCSDEMAGGKHAMNIHDSRWKYNLTVDTFYPENPAITGCRGFIRKSTVCWNELNISKNFHLPPLNDQNLREAVFGGKSVSEGMNSNQIEQKICGTDYMFGFQFAELGSLRLEHDTSSLETLFPFPTLLPCCQEDLPISELFPFQKTSSLATRVLNWIQNVKPKDTLLPALLVQECLAVYIKKQVDHIGRHILLKLVSDWKLMDELGLLRAIYLLGSGDLLQQFLIVIFDKLDKGDSWDDEFELNTILQESIRNSADGTLHSAPNALVVSILNISADEEDLIPNVSTPRQVRNNCFGIDAFDLLQFTYKVSWPLNLIANTEAIRKYNQVMGFLLKVKRAKYVLDKARRWTWKGRGGATQKYKHHLLVEQKLLHFVDAFHQYVMDRVFHSAWIELCSGMASVCSLDEVMEVHEAYLSSVQRQCFVAPDKLWALIASRIKTILGLALDFYSVQQSLSSGGAAPAIKARCEMEMDRIEKQFDDCVAFLLRILSFKLNVGHFPHLVDLVTRINYNYFYMSDNGTLLMTPSFETGTSKAGKAHIQN